jgi:hypothetical protein
LNFLVPLSDFFSPFRLVVFICLHFLSSMKTNEVKRSEDKEDNWRQMKTKDTFIFMCFISILLNSPLIILLPKPQATSHFHFLSLNSSISSLELLHHTCSFTQAQAPTIMIIANNEANAMALVVVCPLVYCCFHCYIHRLAR